jgi:hypothetical protein
MHTALVRGGIGLAIGLSSACPPICEVSTPTPIEVHVRDAQGNPVPTASASITQQGRAAPCQPFETTRGSILCYSDVGPAEIAVDAEGQTLTTTATAYVVHTDGECIMPPAVQTTVTLEGDGCPEDTGTAVVGEVRDAQGDPVPFAEVSLAAFGRSIPCASRGAQFSCRSLSGYSATYTLTAEFAHTRLTRTINVPAAQCSAQTADASAALAKRDCDGVWSPSALAGRLHTHTDTEPAVSVALAGGAELPCHVAKPSYWSTGEYRVDFDCPVLSTPGGGNYELRVEHEGKGYTTIVDVMDDGCHPLVKYSFFEVAAAGLLPAGND